MTAHHRGRYVQLDNTIYQANQCISYASRRTHWSNKTMPAWHDANLAYGSAVWAIRPQANHFAVVLHLLVEIYLPSCAKDTTMPVARNLVCTCYGWQVCREQQRRRSQLGLLPYRMSLQVGLLPYPCRQAAKCPLRQLSALERTTKRRHQQTQVVHRRQ